MTQPHAMNSFAKIHEQVLEQLQRESRVASRILTRLFSLVYEYLEDLNAEPPSAVAQ